MRGVNKVIIIGNLGADPDVKQFQNGGSVTSISVATSEQWNDKQTGERREQTEWHRISLYNKLGEIAAQYLRKGSSVYIEGSLRTRKYQDQNGQERYITEIRADQMQMLGGNSAGQGGYQNNNFGNNFNNNNSFNNQPYQNGNGGCYQNNQKGGYVSPNPYQNGNNNSQPNFNQNANAQPSQNSGFQPQPNTPAQNPQNFGNDNQFMNDNASNGNPQLANASPMAATTPKAGAVDDDIPFVYLSNQLVGII